MGLVAFWFARLKVSLQQEINVFYAKLHSFNRYAFQGIGMQEQQNKFLIDADIGDDDVTLPSLPAVNVPIIENNKPIIIPAPDKAPQTYRNLPNPPPKGIDTFKSSSSDKLTKSLNARATA